MKDQEKQTDKVPVELSDSELNKAQGAAMGGAGNDTLVKKTTIGTAPQLQRYKK